MNEDYPKRGRPPLSRTEPTVVVSVTITESQAEFLKEFGDGNASNGVRKLVEDALRPKVEIINIYRQLSDKEIANALAILNDEETD